MVRLKIVKNPSKGFLESVISQGLLQFHYANSLSANCLNNVIFPDQLIRQTY